MAKVEKQLWKVATCINVHKRLYQVTLACRSTVLTCRCDVISTPSYVKLLRFNLPADTFNQSPVQPRIYSMTNVSPTANDPTKNKPVLCRCDIISPTPMLNERHVNVPAATFSQASIQPGRLISMTSVSATSNDPVKTTPVPKPSTQMNEEFQLRQALKNKRSKTLVLLFEFYRASEKAIESYCNLYHAYGFDVLYVKSFLKHFVWPRNSVTLASKLLQHIETDYASYENILVHAFSMGAYNFTVIMAEMYEKPELHESVRKKIKAVVYDSLTIGSLDNMASGVGQGMSRNVVLQKLIPLLMHSYFYLTWSQTVALYDHYIAVFKQRPLEVPTLLFSCQNDPMSDFHVVEQLLDLWKLHYKFPLAHWCWEKSRHAAHLRIHRDEYVQNLETFLSSVPDLSMNVTLKAKM